MPDPLTLLPTEPFTLFDLATRLLGEREIPGALDNGFIRWCHGLCGGMAPDELAWCSSFLNGVAHLRGCPRSRSKLARSWMVVGTRLRDRREAVRGWDVMVLTRGDGPQPGVESVTAPGHVGLFSRWLDGGARVELLGGNQGDRVSLAPFNAERILVVQRLI